MDFDAFLALAWDDHADAPEAVARRLIETGPALLTSPAQLIALAHLSHHVHGEHLGAWAAGLDHLAALARHPLAAAAPDAQALPRYAAALRLAGGIAPADDTSPAALPADEALGPSDRLRVQALAAGSLIDRDGPRAAALLRQALDGATAAALGPSDPAHRTLAAVANNIAVALEQRPQRSAAERDTMLRAAQAARTHWALAGGWREVERADYRLAMSWRAAGDLTQALVHARACLAGVQAGVQAHGDEPLEAFFAWEALGLIARDAGEAAAHAEALARCRTAFAALPEADQAWCRASLEGLMAKDPAPGQGAVPA
jgi:hypothetical protein